MKRAFASLLALSALALGACNVLPSTTTEDEKDTGTVTDEGAKVTEGENAAEGQ